MVGPAIYGPGDGKPPIQRAPSQDTAADIRALYRAMAAAVQAGRPEEVAPDPPARRNGDEQYERLRSEWEAR